MDIRITDGYELRPIDSLNWQLFELREVNKKDGSKSVEWVATGNYFSRLDGAVEFVMRHLLKKNQKQAVVTLADALDELRGIAAEIKKNMGGVTRC